MFKFIFSRFYPDPQNGESYALLVASQMQCAAINTA
jgi:hypothetical protein